MDGDTTFTKLFVGGLAWKTRRDAVQRHFEQFGEIAEAVVIVDKHTGRSKGYGFVSLAVAALSRARRAASPCSAPFNLILSIHVCLAREQVTFRNPDGAARALQDPMPMIDGRRANCNLAAFGAARHVHPVGAPFGMASLGPAMTATTSSYQGSAPAAMAASYFPQALHAYPYYYGYNGGYSPEIMYQAHMGYHGGCGLSGAQQQQAQLYTYYTAARPAGAHQGQQLQAPGDQTRNSVYPGPAKQYSSSQMSESDDVQQAQHKTQLCADAVPEKPSDDTGMTTAESASTVGSGASEGSSDMRPASLPDPRPSQFPHGTFIRAIDHD
uniref:RRM domain-containing protein n=1 Tax=Leersia perrieri TaxID=77586 RepID=A0A0D9VRU9_9ORYZ